MQRRHGVQELDLSLAVRADAALGKVALKPGGRVADLGCATGAFAARLARQGQVVTCVDVSNANLAELLRLQAELVAEGRLIPVQADLTQLPLESASLDLVFCMEVLEHVDDDRAALCEICRVLRPGGTAVLSVPNLVAPKPLVERLGLASVHDHTGPEHHVREGYSAAELNRLVMEVGLKPTSLAGVGGPVFRFLAGAVSLVHLAYRRGRGQRSWTWADVEQDSNALPLRIYARTFPLLVALVRLDRVARAARASTLLVTAVRTG